MRPHDERPDRAKVGALKSKSEPDCSTVSEDAAPAAKQLTINDADHSASFAWRSAVDQAIRDCADIGRPFTSDTVRERLGADPDLVGLVDAHPNALGARFRSAAARGEISPVGVVPSCRKRSRGHLLRQWVGRT